MCSSGRATDPTFPSNRPLYYYITDRTGLAGTTLLASIRRQVARGVDFVQIREKDLPDGTLYELAVRAARVARGTGCKVLLNGRADLAAAAGLDGVHLPAGGPGVADFRPWVPQGFLIGVSVHSRAEALRAAAAGADYLLLGHVFPTRSKVGYGPPLGISALSAVCASVRIPVLALGGMRPERLSAVMRAGAAGIAGITLFQQCIDFHVPSSQNRT